MPYKRWKMVLNPLEFSIYGICLINTSRSNSVALSFNLINLLNSDKKARRRVFCPIVILQAWVSLIQLITIRSADVTLPLPEMVHLRLHRPLIASIFHCLRLSSRITKWFNCNTFWRKKIPIFQRFFHPNYFTQIPHEVNVRLILEKDQRKRQKGNIKSIIVRYITSRLEIE
jgi:hypothetical protein